MSFASVCYGALPDNINKTAMVCIHTHKSLKTHSEKVYFFDTIIVNPQLFVCFLRNMGGGGADRKIQDFHNNME